MVYLAVIGNFRVGLDPFSGAGTTGVVVLKYGRKYLGIELNPEYRDMSIRRIERESGQCPLFASNVAYTELETA
jgi:DNA modification methylase